MTRNRHTVIHKVGREYVRKIIPADPEPTQIELFVEALHEITLMCNDDEVLVLVDNVLKEYYD